MASNNFDGAVLIDNGVGSPLAPGGYYGFGRAQGADFSTGPRIYAGTGDPDGVLIAPMSSLYLQSNGITGTLFIAADSFGTWTTFATDVDVAALLAAIAVIQGQIVTINAQIAALTAAVATNTAAIAAANANLVAFINLLATPSGAAMIGVASFPGGLQAQLDYIMAQLATIGSTVPGWFGTKTQSPLNAFSDYFTGAALAGKWTVFNPGGITTVAQSAANRLSISQTSHAGASIGGILQAAPGLADYCITAILDARGPCTDFAAFGILLGASDALSAPTTANLYAHYNTLKGPAASPATPGREVDAASFNQYNSFNTQHLAANNWYFRYLRVYSSTAGAGTIALLGSDDGLEWFLLTSLNFGAAGLGGAASFIGLFVDCETGLGPGLNITSSMFRVDATSDMFLPCGGYLS